jgi:hypothetical protein
MSIHIERRNKTLVSALDLIVFVVLALYFSGWSPITAAGRALNTFRSAENPLGTAVVDVRGGASTTLTGTSDAADQLSGTIAQRRTGRATTERSRRSDTRRSDTISTQTVRRV